MAIHEIRIPGDIQVETTVQQGQVAAMRAVVNDLNRLIGYVDEVADKLYEHDNVVEHTAADKLRADISPMKTDAKTADGIIQTWTAELRGVVNA